MSIKDPELFSGASLVLKTPQSVKTIYYDGQIILLIVDKNNSDVLQRVDLKDHTRNTISPAFQGEGGPFHRIVGRY